MTPSIDPTVVAAAVAGDRDAFATVYATYHKQVFAFIYNRISSRATAEDIASTTWIRALASITRYQAHPNGMLPWLLTIARNAVYDLYKSSNYKFRAPSEPKESDHPPMAGPELIVESDEFVRTVQTAVAALVPEQRVAMELVLAEIPQAQAAASLRINVGAFKARVYRARKSLENSQYLEGWHR